MLHRDERRAGVVARLERAGCVAANEEADELFRAVSTPEQLERAVARREAGEPLAWITGTASFGDLSLQVDAGVYVPRRHTEQVAAEAARRLPAGGTGADLCTGTGAVAAYMAAVAPAARVVAVDGDPRAVRCARRNGVVAIVGDLGAPLACDAFDVVAAVAPYVPTGHLRLLARDALAYEPRTALDGGDDGLDVVRRVIADATRILHRGGSVVLELGGDQFDSAARALAAAGFEDVDPLIDEDGDLRGVAARLVRDERDLRPY